MSDMKKILITGATGQIGSLLTPVLRDRYGNENVFAAGHETRPCEAVGDSGPYVTVDVRDGDAVDGLVKEKGPDTIFHLAAVTSIPAEEQPGRGWEVNMDGLLNVLEAARRHRCALFFPSSIAVFGETTPPDDTPQETIQRPGTLSGITKLSGELLCDYYRKRYGLDTRGLRYPGLISHETLPGGDTTDYTVEIFYGALTAGKYTCFLREDTRLDMMYLPDAVRAAIELMEADPDGLKHRNAFNVTAMSVTPGELGVEIQRHLEGFAMDYEIDPFRQAIADSWPNRVSDRAAREEWGWRPEYDLAATVKEMIRHWSAMLWKDGYQEPF
jgi:nucleoside-diphosphate-sugar epimerase